MYKNLCGQLGRWRSSVGLYYILIATNTLRQSYIASAVPEILTPYHRSLQMHTDIVDLLRSHSVTFEASRDALSQWVAEPFLEDDGWDNHWEDLCEAEIDRWNVGK